MKTAGKAQTAVFVGLALWYPILIFHSEPSELRDGGSSIPCKPSCSVDSVVPGPVALDSKVDATGEDLPSGRENVALSAFCFYGFFFFWCKEICFRGYFQLAWHQRAREWQRKLGSLFLSIPQIIFCSYCSQIPLLLTLVRVDSKVCHWDPSSMTWTNIAGKKGIKPVSLLQDFSEPFK